MEHLMTPGVIALFVVMLSFITAFVLGFVLIGFLSNRSWKRSAVTGCGLIIAIGIGAKAAEYGVRYGHWTGQIHTNCVRDSGPKAGCP
jgi:hypothetical protein